VCANLLDKKKCSIPVHDALHVHNGLHTQAKRLQEKLK